MQDPSKKVMFTDFYNKCVVYRSSSAITENTGIIQSPTGGWSLYSQAIFEDIKTSILLKQF